MIFAVASKPARTKFLIRTQWRHRPKVPLNGLIENGQKILIIDDLLATGGTLAATARLVEMAGGIVSGIAVVIELLFLDGRTKLSEYEIDSLIQY